MTNTFLALIFRMRHINRWGLMHNTQTESLMQHTTECALIAHTLALTGNRLYGKAYDADKLAVYALFHDVTEVLTGDLPTPVKYYNEDMRKTYKDIEQTAAEALLAHLPDFLKDDYTAYLHGDGLEAEEKKLLKAADKLCAYIKCVTELQAGNREFAAAHEAIGRELAKADAPEVTYFMAHCMEAFARSLDELKGTL